MTDMTKRRSGVAMNKKDLKKIERLKIAFLHADNMKYKTISVQAQDLFYLLNKIDGKNPTKRSINK